MFELVAEAVKVRMSDNMTDDEIMSLIHEEFLAYFERFQKITIEYCMFNEDQRRAFTELMYDLVMQLDLSKFRNVENKAYTDYKQRTGKTGALNYMINN
ncbi:hypothetical protein [Pectobacterium odoriferum]|uniref:hypothetical protein n=1 Tax=Pectobacterium odoriferum TaxID=78398 RepID=UPI0004FFFF77|nr:hypothetical protein [Pectobacterium odoriferum]KGA31150.1 hypothetical protein KS43_19625 [Pectobacterium odoriferum]